MSAAPERRRPLLCALLVVLPLTLAAADAKNWIDQLLEFAGIAASPGAMKADSEPVSSGDIWIADLGGAAGRRLTSDGGYAWPVFMPGDRALLALRRGALVQLPLEGGASSSLIDTAGIRKLVGFNRQDRDRVLVLSPDPDHPLQVLSLAKQRLDPLPYDDRDPSQHRVLRNLEGQARVYDGLRLSVEQESKEELEGPRTWTEVYVSQTGGAPRRVSACECDNCGQPSLSDSGRLVVYVRQAR
jgi:hypothetical protein